MRNGFESNNKLCFKMKRLKFAIFHSAYATSLMRLADTCMGLAGGRDPGRPRLRGGRSSLVTKSPGVLIIVENLTVPLDRRVWQEATTLRDAGYTVSVICPKGGKYTAAYELLDGIHIFRHPLPLEADGALGYRLCFDLM